MMAENSAEFEQAFEPTPRSGPAILRQIASRFLPVKPQLPLHWDTRHLVPPTQYLFRLVSVYTIRSFLCARTTFRNLARRSSARVFMNFKSGPE